MKIYSSFNEMPNNKITLNCGWTIDQPIPNKLLNSDKIVLEKNNSSNIRYLCVPKSYDSSIKHIIILDNDEYTLLRLLNVIYNFYLTYKLSIAEIKLLNQDCYCYEYIIDSINENNELFIMDAMISRNYFECIIIDTDFSNDIQLYLILSS
jgi:hypothetical protein